MTNYRGRIDMSENGMDKVTEIGLFSYPECQKAAIHGLTDLFRVANEAALYPQENYTGRSIRVSHWELNETSGSIDCVWDSHPQDRHALSHVIAPPSVAMPERMRLLPEAADWLLKLHAGGTRICSVCAGAFVIAQTGLLDGRRATTHWAFAELLAKSYPAVRLVTDNIVIDEGDVITAGGILAWTDLGLVLVERIMGMGVMLATSRFMLSEGPRHDQRLFRAFNPRFDHGDQRILSVQHHIHADPAAPHEILALSKLAGLSYRTFLRRFFSATGLKPVSYIKQVRVMKARNALEIGNETVETIAASVGYSDPTSFRKVFRSIVGVVPQAYRDRFKIRRV